MAKIMKGDITSEALCYCQLITTKDDATLIICKKLWSIALQRTHTRTVSYLVFYGTFSTKRPYHCHRIRKCITKGRGEHKYHAIKQRNNTINQHNHKLSSAWALWR